MHKHKTPVGWILLWPDFFLFFLLFSLALLRWQVTLWVLFKCILQSFLPYSLGYFRTTTPEMCNDFPGKCPSWKLTPCWHGKFQTGACHARYLSNHRQRGSIGQAGILGRSSDNRIGYDCLSKLVYATWRLLISRLGSLTGIWHSPTVLMESDILCCHVCL